jgi:hypothetical protein
MLAAVIAGVLILVRALRSEWRLAVTPCDTEGRPQGITRRERVADEQAADARLTIIAQEIREGRWPPLE